MSSSAADIRSALLRRNDLAQPFVTYLGPDGRIELSGASIANASAKIANALALEFDLEPGDRVGLHLPWHWQRVAWLIGIWSAGLVVVAGGGEECDFLVVGPKEAEGLPGSVQVVSMHPLGMPLDATAMAQLPPGLDDVTLAVRAQPDQQVMVDDHADQVALDDLTQRQLLDRARSFASGHAHIRRMGIRQGETQWWLPALWPLVTEGSIVIGDPSAPDFGSEPVDATV